MAAQHGHLNFNPAITLQGAMATRKTVHRPALPFERLPELLQRIDADSGRGLIELAVQLSLLVFIRSSELRFARWEDRENFGERSPTEGVKSSPRSSKVSTSHLVPLSRQSVSVLERIRDLSGQFDLVFAGNHHH